MMMVMMLLLLLLLLLQVVASAAFVVAVAVDGGVAAEMSHFTLLLAFDARRGLQTKLLAAPQTRRLEDVARPPSRKFSAVEICFRKYESCDVHFLRRCLVAPRQPF